MGTKNGEMSMSERKSEVVLVVYGEERDAKGSNLDVKSTSPMSYSSPEIGRFSPSPNRPPKIPTTQTLVPGEGLSRRNSLSRSMYSKPKSRFGEQSVPLDSKVFEEMSSNSPIRITSNSNRSSPNNNMIPSTTTNPKTPLIGSPVGVAGVDEQEEIYKKVSSRKKLKYRRVKITVLFEWVVLLCLLGFLSASLTVGALKHFMIWGVEIWKWCVLVMVIFCGMLFTTWFMHFVVLLIELNYLLKKKVLYFVHGLKKSVQFCIWMVLVLSTWVLLFNNRGIKRSATANRALDSVTWTIVSLLIGGFLWLLKTLLLKILASSFNVNTYFDRIQESIFHQYVILTLSGPPLFGAAEMISRTNSASQLSYRSRKKKKEGKKKEVIDMNKIHQMKQEKVSAWTMKMLIDVISKSGLSTLSNAFDESNYGGVEQTDKEMTNEMEAIAAAYHIFNNVAHPGCDKIYEMDLRRFMIKEEVDLVIPLIDVADTGQIDKKTLTDWLVNVYNGRKALAHALNDTKTAVKQLDKIVTVVLTVIMIILWLVLMEIASTKVLVLLSSQLVVAAFIFGNTCKTIFEAIIFVFVMHPFDVGDRCVIDGVQMIVEEMNILTTIFLRFDNEKIYYPNSVLATKPISNFYRSPDMGDSLEFSIDFTTPVEKIGALKDQVKKYLEKTPQYWHPNHNMVVKEIENVNKIKMALFFNHTMNFQNYGEKSRRKTELVLEMKKIFEELCIIYNLLPQEVRLINPEATTIGTPR